MFVFYNSMHQTWSSTYQSFKFKRQIKQACVYILLRKEHKNENIVDVVGNILLQDPTEFNV